MKKTKVEIKCYNCNKIFKIKLDKEMYKVYSDDTLSEAKGLLFDSLFTDESDVVKHLVVDNLCKKCW